MSKVTFQISGPVLDWLITEAQEQIPGTNELSMIMQWKEGSAEPTIKQVEKLSKKLSIPFGNFFLPSPPDDHIPLVDYRTIKSIATDKPSKNLVETIYNMEQIATWMSGNMIEMDYDPIAVVGSMKQFSDQNDLAERIRKVLDLDKNWYEESSNSRESFNILRNKISNAGVLVMMNGVVRTNNRRKLNIEEFRAFAITDEYAPLIFINAADSWNGRLFSLIHEFCHICIGSDSLFNMTNRSSENGISRTEVICNRVAAEILVPMSTFTYDWNYAELQYDTTEEVISRLSSKFHCSNYVITRRALDKGFITKEAYAEIVEYFEKKSEAIDKKQSSGNFYNNLASHTDKRFFKMLLNSIDSGLTTSIEAYRLTNTNFKTFSTLKEKMLYGY